MCLNLTEQECLEHGMRYEHESQHGKCRGIAKLSSLSGLDHLWPLITKAYERSKDNIVSSSSPADLSWLTPGRVASVGAEDGIPHQILLELQRHFEGLEDVEERQRKTYVAFRTKTVFMYCLLRQNSVNIRLNLTERECWDHGFRYDVQSHHVPCKGDKTIKALVELEPIWPLITKSYDRSKSRACSLNSLANSSKRPRMNFLEMGIPLGGWLQSLPPLPQDQCKVISDYKVEYEGEHWSLSQLSKFLLDVDHSLRPAPYWQWQGTTLLDLYEGTYPKNVKG